jgi:hypothetical protein
MQMSTSDEEYEAKRQEFEDLSDWDAEVDPTLAVPPPDQFAVDRVRLEQRIVDALPPELLERWNAGDFRYQLTGFNDVGWGWIPITDRAGHEVISLRCHWSTIAAR